MTISKNKADPMSIGYFFTFTSTDIDQFSVRTEKIANYRAHVTVTLPLCAQDKWFAYVQTFLLRIQSNRYPAVRFDYDNVIGYFSLEEIQALDSICKTTSFYIYNAPRYIAEPAPVKLDSNKVFNNVCKEKYHEQKRAAFVHLAAYGSNK